MSSAGRISRRLVPLAAVGVALSVAGCSGDGLGGGFFARLFGHRTPPPTPAMHFVVGDPYQLRGVWHYPRADYNLDQTGLAAIAPPQARGAARLTADGELYDATAMAAGHRTLQLPAIVRVTNLENGRSALLRLNDRGPPAAGRMLELTPRAAELLGARDGTQLRMAVQEAESRQLATSLQGNGPDLALATAPTTSIKAETLAPPSGVAQERTRSAPGAPPPIATGAAAPAAPVPDRLPEQIAGGTPQPGRLFIDAGSFSQPQYARLLAGRLAGLGADVVTDYAAPRDRAYQVRLGPFATVAQSDAVLDRAREAGVLDGRITVQP